LQLVEGNRRNSVAIRYLTQSTRPHAAFFISLDHGYDISPGYCFADADTIGSVRTVGIESECGRDSRHNLWRPPNAWHAEERPGILPRPVGESRPQREEEVLPGAGVHWFTCRPDGFEISVNE